MAPLCTTHRDAPSPAKRVQPLASAEPLRSSTRGLSHPQITRLPPPFTEGGFVLGFRSRSGIPKASSTSNQRRRSGRRSGQGGHVQPRQHRVNGHSSTTNTPAIANTTASASFLLEASPHPLRLASGITPNPAIITRPTRWQGQSPDQQRPRAPELATAWRQRYAPRPAEL